MQLDTAPQSHLNRRDHWRKRVGMKDDSFPQPSPGRLFLKVFPSIMLPMFLAVVDQTIVATALPAIAGSLGGVGRVSWVVVAYLVAATVAAPLYGQLRDIYSARRMLIIGLLIFLAASLFCSLATSIEMLTAARALQGLGGGGLMTLSQALIGEAIPPRERARYQGYLAAVMVTSSTFGPIVAGYHGAVLVSLIAFLPIYLHVGHSASAAETGLRLLPLMLGIGFGSMATG